MSSFGPGGRLHANVDHFRSDTDKSKVCDNVADALFPVAGGECDAEPPYLSKRPPGGYSVRVQPDHSGPGRGHAFQPDQLHRHPAVARHEDLPQ